MGKRKLGRGLQALLGGSDESFDAAPVHFDNAEPTHGGDVQSLPLFDLEANPFQTRQFYQPQELATLLQSVQTHGVIQPILVRPHEGRYQIVAGERRFRAAQEAGLTLVPVRILELNDQQMFEYALIENLQRRDLNAIEKALAFQDYIGRFAVTHEELATHLGVDRSTVTNLIRLLELPGPVQQMVRTNEISYGHARALLTLQEPAEQVAMARRIHSEELSVRQIEGLVREPQPTTAAPAAKPPARGAAPKTNHIVSLENELRQRFGAKVEIRPKAKEKGTILIHFSSNDEFERLLGFLGAA